ncbi:MAG: cellulase family glycosylhydrolase [Acidimicrobiales bacterium]
MKPFFLVGAVVLLLAVGVVVTTDRDVPQATKHPMTLGVSPGATILDLDDDALEADLSRMANLGINELRLDFDWSRIERTAGEYDWSNTDRIVEAASSHDITVHALLAYTPRWARPADTDDKHPPTDPEHFASFAAASVARYSERGLSSWEIWNEPNVASFWSAPSGPDPYAFAALVSVASDAIRSADPNAWVISGGLAPAKNEPGDEIAPETFLEDFFASVEPGSIDAVGIHPYSYPADPDDRSRSWNLFGRLPAIQDLARESTGSAMPLWITEYGAPTGDASRAVSDQSQARMISGALGCVNQIDWIERLFLYNLRDRVEGDAGDIEDNFGLFTADGSPKAAATAVQQFQSQEVGELISSPCDGW